MSSCLTSIEENRGFESNIRVKIYCIQLLLTNFITLTKPYIKTSCSLFNLTRLWTTSSNKEIQGRLNITFTLDNNSRLDVILAFTSTSSYATFIRKVFSSMTIFMGDNMEIHKM
jgi:hypothetical protein